MRIVPVLLDSRPEYLSSGPEAPSLLLLPLGTGTVFSHLQSRLATACRGEVTVLTSFEIGPQYEAALRGAGPLEAVLRAEDFGSRLDRYEPSDWLLLADPRCLPSDGLDVGDLVEELATDPGWVRHLVALEGTSAGTKECVQFDPDGRVRRIQRYYDSVTWSFTSGVACSLLPVASALVAKDLPFGSLAELRTMLASGGVPSRDLPLSKGTFDLRHERSYLSLNERFVHNLVGENGKTRAAGVHAAARLLGPVVVQDGAVVEEGATVVGPSVLGAGCRVSREAVVAQCVVAPGTTVAASARVRHRFVFGEVPAGTTLGPSQSPDRPFAGAVVGSGSGPVELRDERRRKPVYPTVKAVVEALLALVGLIILSPLLILVAILVKLDSKGPVLYGDKREGKDGRVFRCWKFRSMCVDADAKQRELRAQNQMDGPQFKLDRDPRITRMGRMLRPTSLDELPQLINVLAGQMSFVGPRPSPFRENQMCVPWRDARLSVRPGITGLWQVCRHERASGDFHQWIYYDLLYVRLMSAWVDLKILLATVLTLGGKGCVPLSWIVPPHKFYDRRRSRRDGNRQPSFVRSLLHGA